mmetsp:Transcript_7805/g.22930  ORF Transcript_7805/g.22930 Transcript_7805/m.22930 type:complete len:460 (-) Transcript_7805:538-1917(-)
MRTCNNHHDSSVVVVVVVALTKDRFKGRPGRLGYPTGNPVPVFSGFVVEFPQELLLSLRDLLRNLDLEVDDVVSLGRPVQLLDALSSEHQLRVRLAALWDLDLHLAVQRFHVDRASENGLRDGHEGLRVNGGPVPDKVVVLVDEHLDQQVAPGGSRISLGSLPAQPQVHAVVDSRRGVDFHVPLLDLDLAVFPVHDLVPEVQVLGGAVHGLVKGEAHVHLQIGAPLGTPPPAGPAAEKGVEEFLRIDLSSAASRAVEVKAAVLEIESAAKGVALLLLLLEIGIGGGVAKLVVHLSLLVVAQCLVRRRGLLELVRGRLVVLVGVGVILFRKLEIRLFDIGLVCRSRHSQNLVQISLRIGRKEPGASRRRAMAIGELLRLRQWGIEPTVVQHRVTASILELGMELEFVTIRVVARQQIMKLPSRVASQGSVCCVGTTAAAAASRPGSARDSGRGLRSSWQQ